MDDVLRRARLNADRIETSSKASYASHRSSASARAGGGGSAGAGSDARSYASKRSDDAAGLGDDTRALILDVLKKSRAVDGALFSLEPAAILFLELKELVLEGLCDLWGAAIGGTKRSDKVYDARLRIYRQELRHYEDFSPEVERFEVSRLARRRDAMEGMVSTVARLYVPSLHGPRKADWGAASVKVVMPPPLLSDLLKEFFQRCARLPIVRSGDVYSTDPLTVDYCFREAFRGALLRSMKIETVEFLDDEGRLLHSEGGPSYDRPEAAAAREARREELDDVPPPFETDENLEGDVTPDDSQSTVAYNIWLRDQMAATRAMAPVEEDSESESDEDDDGAPPEPVAPAPEPVPEAESPPRRRFNLGGAARARVSSVAKSY